MIRIRAMSLADVPLGLRLKEQAGWNQTEADWVRFIEMERGWPEPFKVLAYISSKS